MTDAHYTASTLIAEIAELKKLLTDAERVRGNAIVAYNQCEREYAEYRKEAQRDIAEAMKVVEAAKKCNEWHHPFTRDQSEVELGKALIEFEAKTGEGKEVRDGKHKEVSSGPVQDRGDGHP